jgi:hypothetical protein
MDKHDVAHYGIAAVVASIAGFGAWTGTHQPSPKVIQHEVAVPSLRGAWPAFGDSKILSIGADLKQLGPTKVTIFCGNERCKQLESDLDLAFQAAGWEDDFEQTFIGSEENGTLIGPPGARADALKKNITAAMGSSVPVQIVQMRVSGDLGVIIGQLPKQGMK